MYFRYYARGTTCAHSFWDMCSNEISLQQTFLSQVLALLDSGCDATPEYPTIGPGVTHFGEEINIAYCWMHLKLELHRTFNISK